MAENFKVEKGVPVPVRGIRGTIYPWADMGVGDSFFAPSKKGEEGAKTATRMRSAAKANIRLCGRKYIVRRVEGGVRVWRTE
ncbi:hypothetical protein LCGC14_1346800 [marine sediment metagenome]|uniref:Uncharacterized protein n=1 Tax=marine sediment metagenome TaxID=412755 RepID=A0A0F9KY51_9ZZZZ